MFIFDKTKFFAVPHIKNALIRYRVIDKCLTSKYQPYPTKLDLRQACEEALYGDVSGQHISDSTIEKDMFAMRIEHDAPIKYNKKNKGYYYDDPDFSINEIPLSENDIESIQFAVSTLAQFRDTDIFKQFGFALSKIIDRVNVNKESKTEEVDQYVQFETANTSSGNDYLAPLLLAIKNSNIVYFDYESFITGNRKRRKVTPLLLKEYRNRWYVIVNDMVKGKIITYGLDRIFDFQVTEQKVEKPHTFNPDMFFKYSIGITAKENSLPQEIEFKATTIAAKYIDSQPFHESQKITKAEETTTTFGLYVQVTEELIREILSYGGEVEVLKPESLRLEIQKRIKSMFDLYSS